MKRAIALFVMSSLIASTGCVPFRGGAGTFRIVAPEPHPVADPAWPAAGYTLAIQRPVADKTRGTSRIVVRSGPSRLAFYPDAAWLDELPEMLQSLLLQAYTDSGRWPGAVRPGTARARFSLASEIRRFEAVDEGDGRLVVELQMQAALLEVRNGRLVASRVFEYRVPVEGDGVDALAAGFEAALGALIGELIGWTLASTPDEES